MRSGRRPSCSAPTSASSSSPRSARWSRRWRRPQLLASLDAADLAASWEGEPGRGPLRGLAVVTDAETAAVAWIPADHLDDIAVAGALSTARVRAHDAKALMRGLLLRGIGLGGLELDTAIAAYLLDPAEARYELAHLVERYTRFAAPIDEPAAKGQLDLDGTPADPPTIAGREALAVHHLVEPITTQLAEQGMADLYATIENPLVRVLARMEHAGIAVDVADLRQLHERLTADVLRLNAELREVVGRDDLNINSPIQLRELLYAPPPAGRGLTADQADQDRRLDRRGDAGEAARRVARVHRPAAAVPGGGEAARHVRRGPAGRGRARTDASTPRSTRPSPAPGGSARTARTCTTSPCGATRAGCSAGRSSPRRAASCSSPTTTRSSCAASPTSPPTPG